MVVICIYSQDYSETARLLSRDNIDEGSLWDYAIEAAAWSTELPKLDFAVSTVQVHKIVYKLSLTHSLIHSLRLPVFALLTIFTKNL